MESRCDNCLIRLINSLRALSKEDLKKVLDSKTFRIIKKGTLLFDEGEKLNGVYCVREGVSKLSKLSASGKDQIIKLVTKGAVIGQRYVVAEESANLSAVAVTDMEVCFIPKEFIASILQTNPNFTLEVSRHMARDLKEADEAILNMSQKNVRQRIAETFLYLKRNFGEDKQGFLALTLSRDDVAGIVGAATESAIRIISEFRKKGLIQTLGKKVGIKDERKLQNLAKGF